MRFEFNGGPGVGYKIYLIAENTTDSRRLLEAKEDAKLKGIPVGHHEIAGVVERISFTINTLNTFPEVPRPSLPS